MSKENNLIVEMGGLNKDGYFVRKIFREISETDIVRRQFNNRDVYCTAYQYNDIDQASALKTGDFYLDFDKKLEDNETFNLVRQDAMRAITYLNAIFQIPINTIKIYFSGHKGIHLIVPKEVMNIEPNANLHRIFKSIAEEIYNYVPNQTLDRQIYDNKRLFRLVNSINGKSGMYKIPLSFIELKWSSYDEVKTLANHPRFVEFAKPTTSSKASMFYKKYVTEWEQKLAKANERKEIDPSKFRKLNTLPPCVDNILNKDVIEGQRNNTAIALANFFQQQRYEKEEIQSMMYEWGSSKCDPPVPESELDTVIDSATKHSYKFGCSSLRMLSTCDKTKCPFFK